MPSAFNYDTDSAVELHRILTAALQRTMTNLTEREASVLADQLAYEVRKECGCGPLYIPGPPRHIRDAQIRAAFNGTNYAELAEEHGITVRYVRMIVKNKPASHAIN